ncbi:hypothetical protein GUITHDRAFT_65947 [Guillardia theta CCMP2712]|uniref:Uncharacterized protein n=1 Tax=Guillardia theta (strain CCMP2712) TaxID=905079 RepID=L1JSY7_GUITC|nr:hypothetical protein GUITHDRAFT_65947 [Guillardia theta CCMP2712]EKX51414.1 hypothetical protein GUITHDRAFT_65947 [Guillardia theta CCMP2712]|eukprot:XP_005838394.1 hypothetical protein GUITHDRAFT_65947 [Guillardia theta CCMP2712]
MCGNLGEDYEDEDDCDRPRWKSFPELEGSEIRSLCSCGQNVGVITEAGDIFTWGANNFGQVGIAPEDEDEAAHVCSPCKLPQLRSGLLRNGPPRQPAQLAVGRGHMACVTTTGELFTWGCNDHGQLGRDSSYKSTRQRDQNAFSAAPGHALDASYRATQVACGSDWTCVVLEEEGVFHAQTGRSMLLSFGRNDKGQCGHGHSSQRADMAFVKLSGVVRTLACGEGHTICVCWGDEVYAWGANECGQLGIGIQGGEHGHLAGLVSASGIGEDWIAEPCRVESLCGRRCVMVAAGLFHSAALVSSRVT